MASHLVGVENFIAVTIILSISPCNHIHHYHYALYAAQNEKLSLMMKLTWHKNNNNVEIEEFHTKIANSYAAGVT